ncbi:MAG: hypoxanthine phosphoribosyltransferase [Chloroflexi bacterium]|nr:hypoxanthine phosphoribosyltransferase [Chloroflexota bacterium]
MTSTEPREGGLLDRIDRVVVSTEEIQEAVAAMGARISADYADRKPVLVGVLTGVVLFMADLLRSISIPVAVDFMAISHYGPESSSGTVRIVKDLDLPITGRHVLFVEDVIDTGLSLAYLLRTLRTRQPASIQVAVLFDRPYRRLIDVPLAYRGLELPDEFVVGYGLDSASYFRNLPLVATLKPGARKP